MHRFDNNLTTTNEQPSQRDEFFNFFLAVLTYRVPNSSDPILSHPLHSTPSTITHATILNMNPPEPTCCAQPNEHHPSFHSDLPWTTPIPTPIPITPPPQHKKPSLSFPSPFQTPPPLTPQPANLSTQIPTPHPRTSSPIPDHQHSPRRSNGLMILSLMTLLFSRIGVGGCAWRCLEQSLLYERFAPRRSGLL